MRLPWVLLCLAGLSLDAAAADALPADMAPLSDTEMSEVAGRQGVVLDLKLRNNVNASFAPIGCTVSTGTPFGTPNPCRIGLEFAARAGIWLMLKEYYGFLHLKDIRMDVTFLNFGASGYANAARFMDAAGTTCLLAAGRTPCLPAATDPAIKLTYPGTDGAAVYDDMHTFLNIGRAWLEFDCNPGGSGATLCTPATSGFNRDTTLDSALGIRMADSAALNEPAHMRFRGEAYVYGF